MIVQLNSLKMRRKRKKTLNKGLLIISIILSPVLVKAQKKTVGLDSFIYNKVYKNIAAFNIKHAQFSLNGAVDNSPFHITTTFFYEAFLPDLGSKMVMDIKELSVAYVDPKYKLYEISLNGMEFQDQRSIKRISGVSPGKYYLIAKKENGEMKFISGQFFLSAISDDFKININKPESLIEYLRFKTWCYKINNIKFVKSKGKRFYFSGFAEILNKNVQIILNKNNIEYPQITSA